MRCHAQTALTGVVILLGMLTLLGACGQKGPLYLPEPEPPASARPGADVPQPPPSRP